MSASSFPAKLIPWYIRTLVQWEKLLLIFLWLVFLGVLGFQALGISQDFFFNEELTQRDQHYTFYNFYKKEGGVHYTPLGNLLTTITYQFFSVTSAWSHLPLFALYLGTAVLFWLIMHSLKGAGRILPLLSLLLFLTMPILSEGTYWLIGSHGLLSVFCFLGFLYFSRSFEAVQHKTSWAAVLWLIAMLSVSPLTYASFFLIAAGLFFRSFPHRRRILFWFCAGCGGLAYIALRNWILNGSVWQFSMRSGIYGLRAEKSWMQPLQILVEIIEYANPIVSFQHLWPQGYLKTSEDDLISLLHLAWIIPLWISLLRRNSVLVWLVALYGLGAVITMLQLTPNLSPRYFIPIAFVQCFGLGLWLYYQFPLYTYRCRMLFLTLFSLILLSNESAKVRAEWQTWIVPQRREKSVLRQSLEAPLSSNRALVFLVYHRPTADFHSGGTDASLIGMKLVLEAQNHLSCVYYAMEAAGDALEERFVLNENSNIAFLGVHLKSENEKACPLVPAEKTALSCWQYQENQGWLGELLPYYGAVQITAQKMLGDNQPAGPVLSLSSHCSPPGQRNGIRAGTE